MEDDNGRNTNVVLSIPCREGRMRDQKYYNHMQIIES